MKKKLIPLALLVLLALSACAPKEPEPTPSPTPTPPPVETPAPGQLVWQDQRFEHSLDSDDGAPLYRGVFLMPGIVNAHLDPAWTAINDFYHAEGQAYLDAARETADLARDDFDVTTSLGYDFTPYAEESYYAVTLHTDALVSIRRTYYSSVGGPYPGNFQFSEVFSLADGRRLALTDLFADPEIKTAVLDAVRAQSERREDVNLDRLELAWGDWYFYLTQDSLVVYFQEGDLAPRAAGLPEFSIPLSDLGGLAL